MKTVFINQRNRYQKGSKTRLEIDQFTQQCREIFAILGNTLGLGAVMLMGYLTATGTEEFIQKFFG